MTHRPFACVARIALVWAVTLLAACSGISIGIGLPIGGLGSLGVSVGSDGVVGGGVAVGRGGVSVGVGGSTRLPQRTDEVAPSSAAASAAATAPL